MATKGGAVQTIGICFPPHQHGNYTAHTAVQAGEGTAPHLQRLRSGWAWAAHASAESIDARGFGSVWGIGRHASRADAPHMEDGRRLLTVSVAGERDAVSTASPELHWLPQAGNVGSPQKWPAMSLLPLHVQGPQQQTAGSPGCPLTGGQPARWPVGVITGQSAGAPTRRRCTWIANVTATQEGLGGQPPWRRFVAGPSPAECFQASHLDTSDLCEQHLCRAT